MKRVYLASPLGFARSTEAYKDFLVSELKDAGFDVFDPWSQPVARKIDEAKALPSRQKRLKALGEANRAVGRANERGIQKCDVLIAVLDGVDVDSGTASEIGYAFAYRDHKRLRKRIRIFGLRSDFRSTGDNEGAKVNLQVQYWIEASKGEIYDTAEDLLEAVSTLAG
ncbi:MAG: nucleoside 2-deoxyribosyltransferase [Chloroflexi bacterium]|nr:nucleoside 2-deoxyribosyltransferase [Chloroflexota bacterium]